MPGKGAKVARGLLAALSLALPAAGGEPPRPARPLASLLRDLQAAGLPIVFSEALVRPDMMVAAARRGRPPRQALEEALAVHGLEAREGPGGRLLVVEARRRALARPAGVPAGQARLKLTLRAEEGGALSPRVAVPQLGVEVAADPDGIAAVVVAPGVYRVLGRLDGFEEWQADGLLLEAGRELAVPVTLTPAATAGDEDRRPAGTLTLRLELRNRHDETLEVREPATPGMGAASLTIGAAEVGATAGAFQDVFRTLPLRPGITPVNEAQGRFSVRAGGPDQNLTLMDGVEIYNPFRLEAQVGAFSPDTVESFDLSAGVMSASHGDRLASVLEVRPRTGRRDRVLRATAAVDAASSGLTLEGALPGGRASWIASARGSTPGRLMARLTRMTALQRFEDLYLRVDWPWRDSVRLSLWTLQAREATRDWPVLEIEQPPLFVRRRLDYSTRNETWAAVGRATPAPGLSSTTVLSRYAISQDSHEDEAVLPWVAEAQTRQWRRVEVADVALRQDFVLQRSAARRWGAGFEVHGLDTAWAMGGKGVLVADWSLFRGPALAPTPWGSRGEFLSGAEVAVDGERDSARAAAWLQSSLAVGELQVEPGLRVQHSSINGETLLLPRARVTWRLGANRLSAAWGWHAQSPGWEKVLLADTFVDYGGPGRLAVASERSRQAVVGIERDLGRRLSARLELFDTRFDRLIVGRLATPEEEVGAAVMDDPVNGGEGTARGAELWLRLGGPAAARGVSGTLAYSYGVSRRRSYGLVHPFDYDRRHALALTGEVPLGRGLGLAAAWRAASGLPYTPFRPVRRIRGYRTPGVHLADLNSARHPFYSRLDLRAWLAPGGPGGRFELYADVYNVLNYDIASGSNSPGFKPRAVRTDEGWEVVTRPERGFTVVPSFGLRLRF